jgi:hypothetical protein
MKLRTLALVRFPIVVLACAVFLLAGCKAPETDGKSTLEVDTAVVASATSEPSATVLPTATLGPTPKSGPAHTPVLPSPTATAETVPVYTPDLDWLASESRDGWQTYENAVYGFRLRYPPGWSLTDVTGSVDTMAGHRVDLVDGADSRNVLRLAFRGLNENRQIVPTGMSQGEIVPRGSILFLGETLTRQALVDRGADSKILYELSEVKRGGLVFWIALDRVAEAGAERGLPEDVQRTVDAILSSVTAP